jgi:hypothetical protein
MSGGIEGISTPSAPTALGPYSQAIRAGAKVTMPLDDMFWGDRYGKLEDPFGHQWSIGTHIRDASPEEMQKAMEQMGS